MDAACLQGITVPLNVGYRSGPFCAVSGGLSGMQATYTPESFKAEFRPHFQRLLIAWGVLIGAVLLLYLYLWQFTPFFTTHGWSWNGSGFIALGLNGVGLIAIGLFNAVGIIAIGTCNAVGIVAIGPCNAVGIVAFGGNAIGVIAIGFNTTGVITIGCQGRGIYSLFYAEKTERNARWYQARYMLAPHRQDAEAIAFFQRWNLKHVAAGILLVGFLAVSSGAAAAVLPCSHCGEVVLTLNKQNLFGKHLIYCPKADR